MPMPPSIQLGRLSGIIARDARWINEDEYPAWQQHADELELLCGFLERRGRFRDYVPRLRGRKKERNSTLNEVRVAFHFDPLGFRILDWEPSGQGNTAGEFLVGKSQERRVFVEVKSPTWEAELSQEQRLAGRTREPKYRGIEGGAFDNSEWIRFAIDKASPKFTPNQANLLVIADDLRVSLQHGTDMFARKALYESRHNGYFTHSGYSSLGGVGIFWNEVRGERIAYTLILYLNPWALVETQLPPELIGTFGGKTL